MKLVILAGGYGTRLSEETKIKPKPLVKIGNRPIIWHIMKFYSYYGINDFIICLGYKGDVLIKELKKFTSKESWKIRFVQTGLDTMTGGRIKKIEKFVSDEENFSGFDSKIDKEELFRHLCGKFNNSFSKYFLLCEMIHYIRMLKYKPEEQKPMVRKRIQDIFREVKVVFR